MSAHEDHNGSPEIGAILFGGGFGLVVGATLGFGLALISGAFASGMGWIVVAHGAFAMILMGGWLAPCFVQGDEERPDNKSTRDGDSLPQRPSVQAGGSLAGNESSDATSTRSQYADGYCGVGRRASSERLRPALPFRPF